MCDVVHFINSGMEEPNRTEKSALTNHFIRVRYSSELTQRNFCDEWEN